MLTKRAFCSEMELPNLAMTPCWHTQLQADRINVAAPRPTACRNKHLMLLFIGNDLLDDPPAPP